jgi:hypothetical protein
MHAGIKAKFGRYTMHVGMVYCLVLSDYTIWFLATRQNKDGGARGLQVNVEPGRKPKKAKIQHIPLAFAQPYRQVPACEVPEKVLERFKERDGEILS